jgi:hypothetical protein
MKKINPHLFRTALPQKVLDTWDDLTPRQQELWAEADERCRMEIAFIILEFQPDCKPPKVSLVAADNTRGAFKGGLVTIQVAKLATSLEQASAILDEAYEGHGRMRGVQWLPFYYNMEERL